MLKQHHHHEHACWLSVVHKKESSYSGLSQDDVMLWICGLGKQRKTVTSASCLATDPPTCTKHELGSRFELLHHILWQEST